MDIIWFISRFSSNCFGFQLYCVVGFFSDRLIHLYESYCLPILSVINSLDHTSLQYGMKSQSPKEKLDPGKQDSLEDLHRYSFIKASMFMEASQCSSLSTVKF